MASQELKNSFAGVAGAVGVMWLVDELFIWMMSENNKILNYKSLGQLGAEYFPRGRPSTAAFSTATPADRRRLFMDLLMVLWYALIITAIVLLIVFVMV